MATLTITHSWRREALASCPVPAAHHFLNHCFNSTDKFKVLAIHVAYYELEKHIIDAVPLSGGSYKLDNDHDSDTIKK